MGSEWATSALVASSWAGSKIATAGNGKLMASVVFTNIAKEDVRYLGVMAQRVQPLRVRSARSPILYTVCPHG